MFVDLVWDLEMILTWVIPRTNAFSFSFLVHDFAASVLLYSFCFCTSLVCYLGAPLYLGWIRKTFFEGLLTRIKTKIHGWGTKFLSSGGRIILIHHVLASIPIYLLQVLAPPKSWMLALSRLLNSFLWESGAGRKMHWKAWSSLCYLMEEGRSRLQGL